MVPISQHSKPMQKVTAMLKYLDSWIEDPTEVTEIFRFLFASNMWKNENPDLVRSQVLQRIGENFCKFVISLPPKSPFRLALLNVAVSSGVPMTELLPVIAVSYSTLKRSKALKPEANLLLSTLYKPNVTRQMVCEEEVNDIIKFLLEVCPVKSGNNKTLQNPKNRSELRPKHWQFITDKQLYEQYKIEFSQPGKTVRSYSFVIAKCKPFNIRKARKLTHADYTDHCPTCAAYFGFLDRFPLTDPEEQKDFQACENHHHIAKHQRNAFQMDRERLGPNECIVVQDFTKFYTQSQRVNDLIFVLYYRDSQGELCWRYFDYFHTDDQTFAFVQAAWTHLLDETHLLDSYSTIRIWSDGGPNHFKIAKTLYWFSVVSHLYHKQIIYNFFASYHGHSTCDSHAGNEKQKVSRWEKEHQMQITDKEEVAEVCSELSNTNIVSLATIPPTTLSIDHRSFAEGIQKYHQFIFFTQGEVDCYVRSYVGSATHQTITERDL